MAKRADTRSVLAGALLAQLAIISCAGGTVAAPAAPLAGEAREVRKASDAVSVTIADRAARVSRWPEATAVFRGRGPWLGADSAYSVDLRGGRVLWLFGDTFVDPARDGSRTNGPNQFVRNSVALQTTEPDSTPYDLSQSQLQFFTGPVRDGVASSFFPETADGDWYWPLSGIRLSDGPLLLFRMRVRKVTTGFGFAVTGWDAVAVDDPDRAPDSWVLRSVQDQTERAERLVGASVMQHGDHLYAYAAKNADADHSLYLARFSVASLRGLARDALADPEWYTAQGFQRQSAGAIPVPVLSGGQIEVSVHFQSQLQRFVEIQTRGLFASDPQTAITLRTSERPEGPWSDPVAIWTPRAPPNADSSKLLTYAAKAHPEQRGGDLILTYMQNDVSSPTPIDAVYYPEVLRVQF
jgi:Domain of unknown function (DUF4185)